MSQTAETPSLAQEAVLVKSDDSMLDKSRIVRGYDFNKGVNYDELFKSYKNMGFQATSLGIAIEIVNKMLTWRLSDEDVNKEEDDQYKDPEIRKNTKCTIFLGYTSNMASCGVRDIVRYLCQHKLVDCIVATAGGIEEDFIKCLADTYFGDFQLNGHMLREKGINRIGNLLVPNDNYCKFEDWIMPIFNKMWEEQEKDGINWTPSKVINRLGKEINHEDSIYYWCWKNDIPVFSPALTDGSLGDMLFFHSYKKPGFRVDIVEDIRKINRMAMEAKKTGMVILGGGLIKHHICNANLMRNGADFSVFINTAQEFDGSDAGARPDEAVSWGKIKSEADMIKVYGESTLLFPILVGETFAKYYEKNIKQ